MTGCVISDERARVAGGMHRRPSGSVAPLISGVTSRTRSRVAGSGGGEAREGGRVSRAFARRRGGERGVSRKRVFLGNKSATRAGRPGLSGSLPQTTRRQPQRKRPSLLL
ncbi:hypothetical protein AAFF_G00061700 [Aldrovandia affinis]|uniref:Uncharacterized protein n=1 Tax=Aldrovandia affinis TaxID=143900 RepID=A0AAD7WE52_9TELE|nr:hypothetical protein AAFF_G00061700 [Aldrovandia affinis]